MALHLIAALNVSELSTPSTWKYPFATRRALNLVPSVPSSRFSPFTLIIYLRPILFWSWGHGTNFHVVWRSRDFNYCFIVLFNWSLSALRTASVSEFGSYWRVDIYVWLSLCHDEAGWRCCVKQWRRADWPDVEAIVTPVFVNSIWPRWVY